MDDRIPVAKRKITTGEEGVVVESVRLECSYTLILTFKCPNLNFGQEDDDLLRDDISRMKKMCL